jgi:hypothetical protein
MPLDAITVGSIQMKSRWALSALLMLCLMATICNGQEDGRFQIIGGDYGKKMISVIDANDTEQAAESNKSGTLWSWGSSPKGSQIVDGMLVEDPRYSLKKLNVVSNWLGDSLVDPYGVTEPAYAYTDPDTGLPVKTYVDPVTGHYYYTYTDAKSGKLVYVYFNPQTGEALYTSYAPISGQYVVANQSFTLPPIFN